MGKIPCPLSPFSLTEEARGQGLGRKILARLRGSGGREAVPCSPDGASLFPSGFIRDGRRKFVPDNAVLEAQDVLIKPPCFKQGIHDPS